MVLFDGCMLKDPPEPNSVAAEKGTAIFFEMSEHVFY